jgi:phosphatidylglycerol:prolipoprotein diacylglycerol transferase
MPYFSFDQIELGPIVLNIWGTFLGLAILAGYLLILKEAKKKDISQRHIFWLVILIVLAGVFGSRLAYFFQFPGRFFSDPSLEIFRLTAGGLMFYGGLFGALIVAWLYLRKNNLNFWQIADMIAPALALGIFIVRIGCSLINDHQGTITDLPWAIKWSDGSLRHPVAEYLALNGLVLFVILWLVQKLVQKKTKKSGRVFIIFLAWYGLSRFFLDFLRAKDTVLSDPRFWDLTVSQWISLSILFILVIMLLKGFFLRKNVIKKGGGKK